MIDHGDTDSALAHWRDQNAGKSLHLQVLPHRRVTLVRTTDEWVRLDVIKF